MKKLDVLFEYLWIPGKGRKLLTISLIAPSGRVEASPMLRELFLELHRSGWLEPFFNGCVFDRLPPSMHQFGIKGTGYERFTLTGEAVEELLQMLEKRDPNEAAELRKTLSQRRQKVNIPVKAYSFDDLVRLVEEEGKSGQ